MIRIRSIKSIKTFGFRQTLAIIPQDPFLFSGTIRDNLDPYVKYSDREIYDVLEKCDLRSLIESLGNGLDSIIVERGRNFSVGQKQVNRFVFGFRCHRSILAILFGSSVTS